MQLKYISTALLSASAALAQSSGKPGYDCYPHCIASTVSNNSLSFGRHYAVLNLDLINGIVGGVENTTAGKAWIDSTANWIDAVHSQNPPPLSIFTRIYFSNSHKPEVGPDAPFAAVGGALGTAAQPETELYPAFNVHKKAGDVVLQKTRYYAGAGNALEQILSTQHIDTVVLSGIRTSGVILSTAYRLFDLDYKVYVIANNTIESPPNTPDINRNILEGILPKLPVDVITIEQAMAALERSGPAIY
ncbi:uncharacterized protein LTR77_009075 [Saxophila tyrrhenica]|uniref:Isochorismatase-like domain-containing protein n=1 Tax=Saxophila tyrrhenica TaxID=1690608 RepID=A0AAV9P2V6_9PEZI|nr:hypothetical protein LTR77_009075 [Saxophila tyrrhenica]